MLWIVSMPWMFDQTKGSDMYDASLQRTLGSVLTVLKPLINDQLKSAALRALLLFCDSKWRVQVLRTVCIS